MNPHASAWLDQSCSKPNELGNYKSLPGNYATSVVTRFIGLKGIFG